MAACVIFGKEVGIAAGSANVPGAPGAIRRATIQLAMGWISPVGAHAPDRGAIRLVQRDDECEEGEHGVGEEK